MPQKGKRKGTRENQRTKKAKLEKSSCETLEILDHETSKPFSVRKCKMWFQEYADEPGVMGPTGIQKLCTDLQLDPEDIVMLVVAWKLNAENLGFFKSSEWCTGMGTLECDSTKKLQFKLKYLKNLINDPVMFKRMYRYAFDFCRNKDQRTLDMEMAIEMLKILLNASWKLLDPFIEFIRQSDYKVINKDQWCNVLEFNRTVKSDLSNYDVDGAWPVMLDEFVEWFTQHNSFSTCTSTRNENEDQ